MTAQETDLQITDVACIHTYNSTAKIEYKHTEKKNAHLGRQRHATQREMEVHMKDGKFMK